MPQAIEWSLATPITSPRFPSISPGIGIPVLSFRGARSREPVGSARMTEKNTSRIQALEHDRRVGAAEAERVRENAAKLHVILALAHDRHVGEGGIEILD